MIIGDELYNAKAVDKAVRLAEMIGMPVTQVRQGFCNFPESHSLWVGSLPARQVDSLTFPKGVDVVINVGNKLQHNSPVPIVPRAVKFIDLRKQGCEARVVEVPRSPPVSEKRTAY
jgi:thiamine pyrophosphate-dependent acetolactate synthase large subunit-like protein